MKANVMEERNSEIRDLMMRLIEKRFNLQFRWCPG